TSSDARPSCQDPGSRWNVYRSTIRLESFGADMHHRRRTDTCRQRSWMRLSLGSWPGCSPGSPLANSSSWLPWPTASGGIGWSRSSGSVPGEAATSAMRACSATHEPGSLVVQERASSEETTAADHPGVLALLSPASLTASRSSRHYLAPKV